MGCAVVVLLVVAKPAQAQFASTITPLAQSSIQPTYYQPGEPPQIVPLPPTDLPAPARPEQVIPPAPQQPAFSGGWNGDTPPAPPPGMYPPPVEQPPSIGAEVLGSPRVFEESPVYAQPEGRWPRARQLFYNVIEDHRNYYSRKTLTLYAVAFGGGAILANTSLDEQFQGGYQYYIGDSAFIHSFKYFGEGKIILPSFAFFAVVGAAFDRFPVGNRMEEFGVRSLRAAVVGAPPMLFMQYLTGGSRPGEQPYNSAWHPFQDSNSVSGHSFLGAIPFLTAASMTERPVLKATLFVGSTATAWSRVNDNAHYLSQIILGWTMAYAAVRSVNDTQLSTRSMQLTPITRAGFQGVALDWRY